jgi:hypothetical protein
VGFGLSVAPQSRRREVGARHTSRSSGLLRMEVSLARVFQSVLKTGGGATASGACDTITEVASDCVGFCYPTFTVFNVLDVRGIIVI